MVEFQKEISVPDDAEWAVLTKENNGNFRFGEFIDGDEFEKMRKHLILTDTMIRLINYKHREHNYYLCDTVGKKFFRVDKRKHIIYVEFNNGDKQDYPYIA